jgi:arylsulfate sulfotransferase
VTRSRQISFLGMAAGILLLLLSLGCGDASSFEASVSPTTNPLVAKYSVMVPPAGGVAWVEFGLDLNYGRQTSPTTATTGTSQVVSLLVAGMMQNTTYHLRGHVSWPNGPTWTDQDRTFTTGKIPAPPTGLTPPPIQVKLPTPGLKPDGGVELFNVVGGSTQLRCFVTDLAGNVIWYYNPGTIPSPTPMKLMANGHMIMTVGDIREIDLTGKIYRSIDVTAINKSLTANGYHFNVGDLHHDLAVLPNGHWITLANYIKQYTNLPGFPGVSNVLGDALIDIDPNGNVAWAWSAFDWLDVNRHLMQFPDWTHSNAVVYTPDGNLLVSMRHQGWILKINYANGTGDGHIMWKLGWEGDFALAGGDVSDWFYAQHFPNLISTSGSKMTLDIFDNGNLRLAPDGSTCGANCYSRATVFEVDEAGRVATLEWQYLPHIFSWWGGSIGTLNNGDIEFDMATVLPTSPASQIMEITPGAAQKTVWQLNISGENAYRGYRIPSLYPGVYWKN